MSALSSVRKLVQCWSKFQITLFAFFFISNLSNDHFVAQQCFFDGGSDGFFFGLEGLRKSWAAPSYDSGVLFDELSLFLQQYASPNPSLASFYPIALVQNKTDTSSKAIDGIYIPDYSKYVTFTWVDEENPPVPSPAYLSMLHVPKSPICQEGLNTSKKCTATADNTTIDSSSASVETLGTFPLSISGIWIHRAK